MDIMTCLKVEVNGRTLILHAFISLKATRDVDIFPNFVNYF
jgi:hypothetical protein